MKICCFGSLNIDMVFSVNEFVRPKETIQSNGLSIYAGGKGLNQAIAIRKSGVEVFMAGSIGEDGQLLLDECDKSGLDRSMVRVLDSNTGTAVIQVSRTGENCIILYDGANKENDKCFIDEVLGKLETGDYLVLQNEINNLDYILDSAKQKGLIIFMNPSPVDESLLTLPLGKCDYLILNEVEGATLSGVNETSEMLDKLHEIYPQTSLILTLGEKGVMYRTHQESGMKPACRVEAVDTTGAGDAFTGYFIGMTSIGSEPGEAIDIAQKAAAISVTRKGASASIPYIDEVLESISGE